MLPALPADSELVLRTNRLVLEPVTVSHAPELVELFLDPELHRYLPSEPSTLEEQRRRCERWERRRSPEGDELWLNWAARLSLTGEVVGHFQAGIVAGGVATLGQLVARRHQRQGLATEALLAVFGLLRGLGVVEVTARVDTRNLASVALMERLGLRRVRVIEAADFFKGAPSDECVYSVMFAPQT